MRTKATADWGEVSVTWVNDHSPINQSDLKIGNSHFIAHWNFNQLKISIVNSMKWPILVSISESNSIKLYIIDEY